MIEQTASELFCTNDYIYAKYEGMLYVDGNIDVSKHRQLALFDWQGNPVRLYVLDWQVETFVVDSLRNRCYLVGIDENEEILLGFFDL